MNKVEDIRAMNPPEGTAYLAYRGSIAHGTHNPDPESIDDIDAMGFVVAPIENYFGLTDWGSRGTKEIKRGRYDCVYYEMRKAVSLLLAGNPNILCSLWVIDDHVLMTTRAGERLMAIKDAFLGRHIYKPLAGYAAAQLGKMESQDPKELLQYLRVTNEMKVRGIHPNHHRQSFPPDESLDRVNATDEELRAQYKQFVSKSSNIGYMGDKRKRLALENGYDTKNAAHLVRLLRMGLELMRDGQLNVMRKDADELRQIKSGKWTLQRVKDHAEDLFAQVKSARLRSSLPEGPDRDRIERELVSILRDEVR